MMKKLHRRVVTTFAGTGTLGTTIDPGMNPLTSTFSAPVTLARDHYNNIYIGGYGSGSSIAVVGLENLVLTDRWEYGAVTTGNTGVIGTLSVSTTADVVGATTLSNTFTVCGASV